MSINVYQNGCSDEKNAPFNYFTIAAQFLLHSFYEIAFKLQTH